jgi:hypothetical protein
MIEKLKKNWPVIIAILATAIERGLNYKYSNQNTYLADGLVKVDPSFIPGDWFAYFTLHYHDNFSNVLLLLDRLGLPLDIGSVMVVVLLRILILWAIYKTIYLVTPKFAIEVFVILLCIIVGYGTSSVGGSSMISSALQPSVFGAAFSFTGIVFFLRGNYLASGLCLAFGGYMHTNYLILGFVYLGLSHLFLGTSSLMKRLLLQFVPMIVALAPKVPFLLDLMTSENSKIGSHIFMYIRSPHHYLPSEYPWDFVLFAGWTILGVVGLRTVNLESDLKKRLTGLYCSLLGMIVIASLLTTIVFIPTVSRLFFWRMAPFCDTLSQILFTAAMVSHAFGERRIPTKDPKVVASIFLGFCLILGWTIAVGWDFENDTIIENLTLFGFAFIAVMLFFRDTLWKRFLHRSFGNRRVSLFCGGMLLIFLSDSFINSFHNNSNLLKNDLGKAEAELYEWTKTTEKGTRFVVPLWLANFRLRGERAIIVDWKSTPVDPDGLVEWYRRVQDVSGVEGLDSSDAAYAGYLKMDEDRLRYLVDVYDIDYAVLQVGMELPSNTFPLVFQNEKFAVLELP